jgi:hypothetical protein
MPILYASQQTERQLIELPESGIGFQIIRYRGILVALNATVLVPLEELRDGRATPDELAVLLATAPEGEQARRDRFDFEGAFGLAFSQLDPEYWDVGSGLRRPEMSAAPPENVISPKRPYSYYRFSAAPRDKRIMPDGSSVPGTYATTYADLHFVPSGYAAVGRYALPNPASARFVFQIITWDRPTKMGTATPNFGQAGGGVKVLFASGARNSPQHSFMIDAG